MTLRELLMARFQFFHDHDCSLDSFDVCGTFNVVFLDKVEYLKERVQIGVFHFAEGITNCVSGVWKCVGGFLVSILSSKSIGVCVWGVAGFGCFRVSVGIQRRFVCSEKLIKCLGGREERKMRIWVLVCFKRVFFCEI